MRIVEPQFGAKISFVAAFNDRMVTNLLMSKIGNKIVNRSIVLSLLSSYCLEKLGNMEAKPFNHFVRKVEVDEVAF